MSWEKNPERQEYSEFSHEILWLKESVKKDADKFNSLSKSPEVKRWLSKILDKIASNKFSEKWKKFDTMNISSYMDNLCKQYPSLLLLKQHLWLSNVWNFSTLTTKSKLSFMALYEATQTKSSYESVMKKYKQNIISYTNSMNRVFKWEHISNFFVLETTLSKDFWLSQTETKKVSEYLQIIQKHPSYVWLPEYQEAKTPRWYIIVAILWVAFWALWMYTIEHAWWPDLLIIKDWDYSITDAKEIMQILWYEWTFKETKSIEIPVFDENSGSWIVWWALRWIWADGLGTLIDNTMNSLKWLWNKFVSKEMVLSLAGKVKMSFDIEKNSTLNFTVKDGVADVELLLPEPDIIVVDDKLSWERSSFEIIHFQEFETWTEEARQEIVKSIKENAKNDPQFYSNGVKSMENMLRKVIETMYVPVWVKVWDVRVKIQRTIPTPTPEW